MINIKLDYDSTWNVSIWFYGKIMHPLDYPGGSENLSRYYCPWINGHVYCEGNYFGQDSHTYLLPLQKILIEAPSNAGITTEAREFLMGWKSSYFLMPLMWDESHHIYWCHWSLTSRLHHSIPYLELNWCFISSTWSSTYKKKV